MTIRRLALALGCLALAVPALAHAEGLQRYVIERDLPGAGRLSPSDLEAISQKSRDVLRTMGTKIQWVQSYVTADKIYCVYLAENEADIRLHAKAGGFPVTRISRIATTIDPATAK